MPFLNVKYEDKDYETSDFIPITCHFNKNTVLTKNGELIKVIKLTGLNIEKIQKTKPDTIRLYIRKALKECIKNANIAIWIHTIRRKKNISLSKKHSADSTEFVKTVSTNNINFNKYEKAFVNEVFISLIIQPIEIKEKGFGGLISSFFYPKEFEKKIGELENANIELENICNSILKTLNHFGAELLEIKKSLEDGVFYSSISGFFSKLINFRENNFPLAFTDLSQVLSTHKFRINFNYIEFFNEESRHFASVLTLKEYHEISATKLNKIFSLPIEFIVYETFDFTEKEYKADKFAQKYEYLTINFAEHLAEKTGLSKLIQAEKMNLKFGEHQLCFCIIGSTKQELEEGIEVFTKELQNLGLVVFREDLFTEECYWACVPSNFNFLKRLSNTVFTDLGGFAILSNVALGYKQNNHWGDAISILKTEYGTPYYFNFHQGSIGHTLVVGALGSGKTVLINFLILEALKFDINLIYVDTKGTSQLFIPAIGGKYLTLNKNAIYDNKNNKTDISELKSILLSEKILGLNPDSENIAEVFSIIKETKNIKNKTIFVLNESWQKAFNENEIEGFLNEVTEKNSFVIFITDKTDIDLALQKKLNNLVATKIFFANNFSYEAIMTYISVYNLTEEEIEKITSLKSKKRLFIIKNADDAYPISSKIPFLTKEQIDILSTSSQVAQLNNC